MKKISLASVVVAAVVSLTLPACSSSDSSSSSSSGGSSSGSSGSTEADCTFITPPDLQSAATIAATLTPRDPAHGAGSTCNGNFVFTDGAGKTHMVLMIDNLSSRDQFDHPSALQTSTYPNQEAPTDLGAEAKLFLGSDAEGGAKVLWLWKGDKGFQLVSFFKVGTEVPQVTKAQMLALGKIAATRF